MTSYLRPDEQATQSEIKRATSRTNDVKTILSQAASFGTAGLAAKAGGKILPFLSQYIPEELAYKGINKVMPKLGAFLKDGMAQGLSLKSGLDYLKSEFGENSETQEPAKENRNIVEQYSPNLHQYILDLIKQGNTPIQAGTKAKKFLDKKHQDIIKKIENDHKTDWARIIESVYGGQGMALPQSSGNSGQMQQQQPSQQNMQQQGQGLDPGIQAALQKIMQM